jgi:hypothetical protein
MPEIPSGYRALNGSERRAGKGVVNVGPANNTQA